MDLRKIMIIILFCISEFDPPLDIKALNREFYQRDKVAKLYCINLYYTTLGDADGDRQKQMGSY